jgi:hypothetical protein
MKKLLLCSTLTCLTATFGFAQSTNTLPFKTSQTLPNGSSHNIQQTIPLQQTPDAQSALGNIPLNAGNIPLNSGINTGKQSVIDSKAQSSVTTVANNNWRYRYHNNHWWYWQPNNTWMIYHHNGWVPYDRGTYSTYYPRRTTFAPGVRTYSGRGYNYYPRNTYYDNRFYGPYPYRTGYRGYNYGYGYSPLYYNRGANVGANIGGAIGGQRGANLGSIIGRVID